MTFSKGWAPKPQWLGALCVLSVTSVSSPVQADFIVTPGVELRQVISNNSRGSGGVTGWLEAAAFMDVEIETNRVQGSGYLRAGRAFKEFGSLEREERYEGSLDLKSELLDDFLFMDFGGIASQYAADPRGFNLISNDADSGNTAQVFSGYVEPRVMQRFGNFADFEARYRFGAVSADGPNTGLAGLPEEFGLGTGDTVGALLTDSVTQSGHLVLASPEDATSTITWALSGSATHEDLDQLDQKYRSYRGLLDVGVRVTRSLQIVGSAGYEDIENTQDSILFGIDGLPVLDAGGNLQIDPAMPRRTAFAIDGMTWDAGFRWAPSRRTLLEVRGGRRFGDTVFSLNMGHMTRGGTQFTANWQETLNSFSRLLTQSLNGVPIAARQISGGSQFGVPTCVIGVDASQPSGCAFGLSQAITPATFKLNRGTFSVGHEYDAWSWNVEAFYDQRRYLDSQQLQTPGTPQLPPSGLLGKDQSFGLRSRADLKLSERETLGASAFAARNKFALTTPRKDYNVHAGLSYRRSLSKNLAATTSGYLGHTFSEFGGDYTSFTASVGLQYVF